VKLLNNSRIINN